MNDDKALTYVGQIMTAYNNAENHGATALRYALECGKYLNLAFENVEEAKGKGKWTKWRKENLPLVSEETERVYRRLADAVAHKDDFFAKCKSIRDAIKHRAKYDENFNLKPAPVQQSNGKGTGSSAAGLTTPQTDTSTSGGLEAELENAAADEIISSIQRDADKLEEVAKASIAKLSPDKVCDALTKAWDQEQLRDLVRRVQAHLTSIASKTTYDMAGLASKASGETTVRRNPTPIPENRL